MHHASLLGLPQVVRTSSRGRQGVDKQSTSSRASSFHHASCILNRESFMRFAAMLLMLITMSVGQVWALDYYIKGNPTGGFDGDKWKKMYVSSTGQYAYYYASGRGDCWINTSATDAGHIGKDNVDKDFRNLNNRITNSGDWDGDKACFYDDNSYYIIVFFPNTSVNATNKPVICANKGLPDSNTMLIKNNCYAYFDNSNAGWNDACIQWVIGHDSYYRMHEMTKVPNTTNLYYRAHTSSDGNDWSDAKFMCMMGADGKWASNNKGYWDIMQWASHKSAAYNANLTTIANGTYLMEMASGDNGTPMTFTHKSNGYSDLNYRQIVKRMVSVDGGEYTDLTNNIATIKVSTYALTGNGTTAQRIATIADAQSTANANAALTAAATYSVSGVQDGYTFVGWYDGDTRLSTETTYTIPSVRSTNTITARFEYTTPCSAPAKPVISGTTAYLAGQTITLTATEVSADSYQWYKGEEELTGKTDRTLTISSCTEGDAGTYYYKATNTCGTTSSDGYTITVAPARKTFTTDYYLTGDFTVTDFANWKVNPSGYKFSPEGTQLEKSMTIRIDPSNRNYVKEDGVTRFKITSASEGWNGQLTIDNVDAASSTYTSAEDFVAADNRIVVKVTQLTDITFTIWKDGLDNMKVSVNAVAVCEPTAYTLEHTTQGKVADFVATGNANEYELTFKLNNNIINNLYVEDNCRNRYGCSTAIEPGHRITLTTDQSTFNFQRAAQNKTWKYTFNASTKELSCDAQSEEEKVKFTVTIANANSEYGSVSTASVTEVANGSSITFDNTGDLMIGSTAVTATPNPADAQYTYTFTGWSSSDYTTGGTVAKNGTVTANFARTINNYDISTTLSHVAVKAGSEDFPAQLAYGGSFSTIIAANAGYLLPSDITVTGADKTWNQETGALTISNVTGAVSVTITAEADATPYDGNLYLLGNCTRKQPLGWDYSKAEAFTKISAGVYEIEDIYFNHSYATDQGDGFKLITTNTNWNPKFVSTAENTEVTTTGAYPLMYVEGVEYDHKFVTHAEGHYKLVVNFTSATSGTIQALPVIPDNLAVVGPIVTSDYPWNAGKQSPMNAPVVDNVNHTKTFTWEKNLSVDNYAFCFCSQSAANDFYLHANQATLSASGCTLSEEDENAAVTENAYHNFNLGVTTAGVHRITVTYNTDDNTVTVNAVRLQSITVQGRFTIDDGNGNLTHTGANAGDWNDNSTNIKFAYDAETGYYKLETHRTQAQLATGNQVFHFKVGSTNYGANGNDVAPGLVENKKELKNGWSNNFLFTNGDKVNIVLWIDLEQNKFWYSGEEETKYAVTVSNGEHGTVSPTGEQQVGLLGLDLTVTPAAGYLHNGWETTGGAHMEGNHLTATADGTVTATYRAAGSTKIYFYNDKDWATVKVHKWGGSLAGTDWPGVVADLEPITHDGHTIYSVTITEGEYENVIFNNGESGNGNQISTVAVTAWTAAKPCLRHTSNQGSEWIALPTQNYQIVYGSKIRVTGNPASGSYIDAGTELTFTAAAPETGYTFAGFFSDALFEHQLEDGSDNTYTTTISAATTVYAKYTPITYSITYNTMGGAEVAAGEYTVETETLSLPVPTKSGYAFRGWYTNEACTEGKTTEIAHGSTGDREFFAKWKQEGWYLNWQDESDTWHNDLFIDGQVTISVSTASHDYPMEVIYVQHGVTDRFYKNGSWMPFNGNSENWEYTTLAVRHGFTSTIAGNYLFTMTVNSSDNPVLTMVLPRFECAFNIPALVNTVQPTTVTFTPTVVNFGDVTYELYYTNDGGESWTSCVGVSESAGVYSYNNTFGTAGTYQLKVVVKNGAEQVGEPFLSSEFTVVAPTISIAVSDHPRAEQTVTVTPTVTGLQSGEYHYCWSIVDQSIDFTDHQDGTWTFTAPAAGAYTLRLEVKPGNDCSASAIISTDKELTILGNSVTVNAGLQYAFWQGVKLFYDGTPHNMNDMGTDRNGVHWFTAEVSANRIGFEHALFFNAVDATPQNGSAQTSDFTIPADNTCYLIKSAFNNDQWGNRQCTNQDITCPGAPEAEVTSANHVVVGGKYQIRANYYMIPGNVTYSYSVNNGAVSVSQDGTFVASTAGTYTITVTVTGDRDISATSEAFTLTCSEASVTATATPAAVNLNGTVALTATPTNMTDPTYQWYVKQPGTTVWTTLSGYNSASANYIVKWNGDYQFKVEATEDGATVSGTTETVTVTVPEKWIKFRHADETGNPSGHDSEARHWGWRQMTYNPQDGCYWYLGYKSGSGVNICATATDDCGWKSYSDDATFFTIEDGVIDNAAVYFVYNPDDEGHLYLKKAADYYRVRSNAETGVYYSNVVTLSGEETKDVSFFATKGANSTLVLEKFENNDWTKQGENLNNSVITANNVYTAKLSSTALSNVKAYTGDFWVYSDAAGNATTNVDANKMQRFNNVDEAEFYNHYKCVWLNEGDDTWNTGGTVGNAINHNLAITLPKEMRNTVSVRYAYDPETNHFSRAYLAGARGDSEHNFLVVYGTNITEDKDDNPKKLTAKSTNESTCQAFSDGSDWVYTTFIRATNPATIKLAALNNDDSGNWQFLLDAGGSEAASRNIYGAINDGERDTLRFLVTYDFKTNRVIAAWMPTGEETFDHPVTIDADLVVTRSARKENNPQLFTLLGDGQVKLIRKIITVVTIDRDDIFNSTDHTQLKHEGYGDRLFQISLPYEVKLSQVTGLENYGSKVVLQSYRGDLRALMSWQSHIETFWSNVAYNSKAKLEANTGYYISHLWNYEDFTDVEIDDHTTVARKRIFFPSEERSEGYIIGPVNKYEPTTFAPLTCSKAGREHIDSNWRLIGLPGFFPATPSDVEPDTVMTGTNNQSTNVVTNFSTPYWVYDWNDVTNTYTVYRAKDFRFEPTKTYFVQYTGTVAWGEPVAESHDGITVETYPVEGPHPVAARSGEQAAQGGEYKLVLENSAEKFVDQTYVILDAKHNDSYEAGADFQKMFTTEAALLYSEAGGHQLAANMLSDTTTMVALGTSLPEPGEYTIHLGQMSAGAQLPVLYDAELGIYTALTQQSYTFSGVAGKQSGRFYLIFGYKAPATPTDMGDADGEQSGVEKFINKRGELRILRDGHIFDATGRQIK